MATPIKFQYITVLRFFLWCQTLYRHIFDNLIAYCPGQCALLSGLEIVQASNFTMVRLKRFLRCKLNNSTALITIKSYKLISFIKSFNFFYFKSLIFILNLVFF